MEWGSPVQDLRIFLKTRFTVPNLSWMPPRIHTLMQAMKHRVRRVFSPDQNIEADAYRLNFRFYHDTFVKKNKVKGIYVHAEA